MRKRRKTRYIWLPTLGADPNPASLSPDASESNGFAWSATSNSGAGGVNLPGTQALFPILEDTPQEQVTTGNPDPNIADFIGTDYVIKRIVGKIHASIGVINSNSYFNYALVAGFFVARAEDQNPLIPIGAAVNTFSNYDPNYVDTIREPWIWRRTWILSNTASANGTAVEAQFGNFPTTTAGYGSIQDGGHIDAKTGRRVRNDERLWFAASLRGISSTNLDYSSVPANQNTVAGYLDVRVLGALRKARNRSNF